MAGTVDMGVMAVRGFIFDVGGRDSDAPSLLFWGFINGSIVTKVGKPLGGLILGDGGSQRSL